MNRERWLGSLTCVALVMVPIAGATPLAPNPAQEVAPTHPLWGAWVTDIVDTPFMEPTLVCCPFRAAAATAPDGTIHLAHAVPADDGREVLRYISHSEGDYDGEVAPEMDPDARRIHVHPRGMAIASDGSVYIASYQEGGGDVPASVVVQQHRADGTWDGWVLERPTTGFHADRPRPVLSLSPDGILHILYGRPNASPMIHAALDTADPTSGWTTDPLYEEPSGPGDKHATIASGPGGSFVIAYHAGPEAVRVTRYDASGRTSAAIDAGERLMLGWSVLGLGLLPDGRSVVSVPTVAGLMVAIEGPDGHTLTHVDPKGTGGADLTINDAGDIVVCYPRGQHETYAGAVGTLTHVATLAGGLPGALGWHIEAITTSGFDHHPMSCAVTADANGRPVVVYGTGSVFGPVDNIGSWGLALSRPVT